MTADPKALTPADVPALSGRELKVAMAYYGLDHRALDDANICLAFWEPGGALCDVAGADIIRSLIDVLRTQGVKAFLEAACRAAVLEAMRRKGT